MCCRSHEVWEQALVGHILLLFYSSEQEKLTKEEEERAEKAEKELEDSKNTVTQLEAELEQLKLNVEQSRGQTGRGSSRSSQKGGRKPSRVQPPSRSENRKL